MKYNLMSDSATIAALNEIAKEARSCLVEVLHVVQQSMMTAAY